MTFVPLAADQSTVGPRVLLVAGYDPAARAALAELALACGCADLRVLFVTAAMRDLPLGEALVEPDGQPVPADRLPPIMVLAGLTGHQISRLVDNFSATGLPRPIFAAATATSLRMPLRELFVHLVRERQAVAGTP